MLEISEFLEAHLLKRFVLTYDENRKLLGSIGNQNTSTQRLIFDPGINFEQDYWRALEPCICDDLPFEVDSVMGCTRKCFQGVDHDMGVLCIHAYSRINTYVQLAVLINREAWQEDHVSSLNAACIFGLVKASMIILTFDPGREFELLADELHFEITPVSLAKEQCVLRAREVSMFTDLIKLLAAFPVQEGIPTPYIGILCLDLEGGLPTLCDFVSASKSTGIRVLIPTTNFHLGWNTKARLKNGEFMLKTESKENLLSFCSMSMQKLEHIDEATDEIMNSPGASLYSAGEELLFVKCVVYLFTGIKPLLANVKVSRKNGSLWYVDKRLGSNDRYALRGVGTFFLVTKAAAVEILTFDPKIKEFMPDDLVFDLSNKSELNHPFTSRLKHSSELQLVLNSASNACWVAALILPIPKSAIIEIDHTRVFIASMVS